MCHGINSLTKIYKCLFAYEHDVVFNPKKTACMLFGCITNPNDIGMYLGGEKLSWVESFKHLGHIVTPALKNDLDFQYKNVIYLDM